MGKRVYKTFRAHQQGPGCFPFNNAWSGAAPGQLLAVHGCMYLQLLFLVVTAWQAHGSAVQLPGLQVLIGINVAAGLGLL